MNKLTRTICSLRPHRHRHQYSRASSPIRSRNSDVPPKVSVETGRTVSVLRLQGGNNYVTSNNNNRWRWWLQQQVTMMTTTAGDVDDIYNNRRRWKQQTMTTKTIASASITKTTAMIQFIYNKEPTLSSSSIIPSRWYYRYVRGWSGMTQTRRVDENIWGGESSTTSSAEDLKL